MFGLAGSIISNIFPGSATNVFIIIKIFKFRNFVFKKSARLTQFNECVVFLLLFI